MESKDIRIPAPIARLASSEKRHRCAKGGRGSGKSYSIHGIEAVLSMRANRPRRVLVTRETQNSLADSSLADMKRAIGDWGLSGGFVETKVGLRAKNGSEFIFRGLQHPDRVKSISDIDACIVEEAQGVSRSAIEILVPTVRKSGSYFWWIWNPQLDDDPVDVEFVQSGRDDVAYEIVNHEHNRWFPQTEMYHEMLWDKANDYEKYLHVWEGHTRSQSDAQVFKGKWRVAQFTAPDDAVYYYGADWGFAQDPTALVRCYIHDATLWIDYEAYGVSVDIDDTPALFAPVPGADKWMVTADSARPETISYMQKQGYRMRGAQKGKGSIEDGIAFLRSFREIIVHERCKHAADEMKLYSYKTDKLTGEVLPVLEDNHNHCIDALRYALEQVMLRNRIPTVTVPFKR